MNWDRTKNRWKQHLDKTMSLQKNMIINRLAATSGKYELFVEIFQNKCGVFKEAVNRQVDAFKTIMVQLKNPVGS